VPDELDPPLRVDWLAADDLRDHRPARLGLTFLPGKHGASVRYPGLVYRRELESDLAALATAGVHHLVLLVEDAELRRWGDPSIVEVAAGRGIAVERRPIPDGSPPASLDEMDAILASIAAARDEGDVAVACMGGVGRTGVVAASVLVAAGWAASEAIGRVRAVRHPEAVETPAQEAFVRAYERHMAARRRSGNVAP
jgi:protein-tyrosine phosphatase